MIDTHCHLLPGIDDGPADMDAAVEIAFQLSSDGVRTVVCTPHYSRRYETSYDDARRALDELRNVLHWGRIELELMLAAEVSPGFAVSSELDELRRRALGGRYCLVELLHDTPAAAVAAMEEHLDGELTLILAHPERNRAVQRRSRMLDAARREGALVQVVAPSLTGRWGPDVADTAWHLLESGRADLLASDAHRAYRDGSQFAAALALVERRLGSEAVEQLTRAGPAAALGARPDSRERLGGIP